MRTKAHRAAFLTAAVTCLSACAVGPNYRAPAPDAPAHFAAAPAATTAATDAAPTGVAAVTPVDLTRWWQSLNDPELDALVARAIRSNPDLDVALLRLQQARTAESVALGILLPGVDASAAAARGTGTDLSRGRAEQPLVSADNASGLEHINTLEGFDSVWELDVFGKFRREIEALRADAQAAAAARSAVLTTIVADVVRAYVDLRGYQVQAGVLRNADAVLRDSLRIETIRYERGITNELDVALAQRELATLEARLAALQAQISASEFTVAALLGAYPETLVAELAKPDLIPVTPAGAAPGLPLDVLKRRPDVQQAERELAATTARVGVATADLYPQVALIGSIGAESQGWGTSPGVGEHVWSFGPSAIWPVLDFGALDARVDAADLQSRIALTIYRKTLIDAVEEVDAALAGYAAQQDRLSHLGDALAAAQRALDLATQRYDRGLTDFLNVVDAERQLYDLQEQYAQAQVSAADEFVRLYKSLGGGWEHYQSVPTIRRPQPAILAAFRRLLSGESP